MYLGETKQLIRERFPHRRSPANKSRIMELAHHPLPTPNEKSLWPPILNHHQNCILLSCSHSAWKLTSIRDLKHIWIPTLWAKLWICPRNQEWDTKATYPYFSTPCWRPCPVRWRDKKTRKIRIEKELTERSFADDDKHGKSDRIYRQIIRNNERANWSC